MPRAVVASSLLAMPGVVEYVAECLHPAGAPDAVRILGDEGYVSEILVCGEARWFPDPHRR